MRIKKTILAFAAVSSVLVAAACGGNDAALGQARGLKCVDDSNVCISQRKEVYDSYMTDPSAILGPPTCGSSRICLRSASHGVQQKRKELKCDELAHAKAEADRAPSALSGGAYSGLTSGQIARARCSRAKCRVNWRRNRTPMPET